MLSTKRFGTLSWVILIGGVKIVFAQMTPEKNAASTWIKQNEAAAKEVNQRIWNLAELGLTENQSSRTLIDWLTANGFKVDAGVASMSTAFIASFGSGQPIIAILAEYDALPGLSQKASPIREAAEGVANGHACGHSIYSTASTAAALAASQAMAKHGIKGTIRLYGTPAEETGIGKIYMAKEGLFKDCDAILHWHASDETRSSYGTTKALVSVKFTFHGLAAHASRSPHEGKSALDAVELMNIGANFHFAHSRRPESAGKN